jgi:hypothetical protein
MDIPDRRCVRPWNDPDDLAAILWAAMSGLIGLAACGRIEGGPNRARRNLARKS